MNPRAFNVLFLCTSNSARSIMAECALNRGGGERFKGFSAGSHPVGEIHPMTLEVLKELNYDTSGLRSKSWNEFARPDNPPIDLVLTLCDDTAGQTCPVWPGKPLTAHWGLADPAHFEGTEGQKRRIFLETYRQIESQIRLLILLPVDVLDRLSLQRRITEIGKFTSLADHSA
jgi:arsenate reductase